MSEHNSLLGLKIMDMKLTKDESISEQSIYDRYGKNYIPLTETTLNRLVHGHDDKGYIVISAAKSENKEDKNNLGGNSLISDLKRLGYSYVPVFCGYKEDGQEKASLEESLVVFPYDIATEKYDDFDNFKKNLIDLGKKYEQECILVKETGVDPICIHCDTGETDEEDRDFNVDPQKFTFEAYIAEQPQQIMSAHARYCLNEFVIPGYKGE